MLMQREFSPEDGLDHCSVANGLSQTRQFETAIARHHCAKQASGVKGCIQLRYFLNQRQHQPPILDQRGVSQRFFLVVEDEASPSANVVGPLKNGKWVNLSKISTKTIGLWRRGLSSDSPGKIGLLPRSNTATLVMFWS